MEQTLKRSSAQVHFGSTAYADTVPDGPTASNGPVYLEGRLVLSLSFQGASPINLDLIADDDIVLENYRLWDDAANAWHAPDLAVLRFEHADVVMRLEPTPMPVWAGALDTHKRVVPVPDLDGSGLEANSRVDLRWKRV